MEKKSNNFRSFQVDGITYQYPSITSRTSWLHSGWHFRAWDAECSTIRKLVGPIFVRNLSQQNKTEPWNIDQWKSDNMSLILAIWPPIRHQSWPINRKIAIISDLIKDFWLFEYYCIMWTPFKLNDPTADIDAWNKSASNMIMWTSSPQVKCRATEYMSGMIIESGDGWILWGWWMDH